MVLRHPRTSAPHAAGPSRMLTNAARPGACGWRARVAGPQHSGFTKHTLVCKAQQGSSQATIGLLSNLLQEPQEATLNPTPDASSTQPEAGTSYVSAPLLKIGAGQASYVALALRFPNASTTGQRKRGQRGVSLDFILDTGSTVNVLNPAVARELQLPVVGVQPAGAGAGGGIASAPIFLLGDTQLDYLAPEQRFTFMTGLQAAGLMVPSPACSGILGRAFIDQFPAVELRFTANSRVGDLSSSGNGSPAPAGDISQQAAGSGPGSVFKSLAGETSTPAPSEPSGGGSSYEIRFHQEYDINAACAHGNLRNVPLSVLGVTGLWGAQMRIQGPPGTPELVVPALVDTGAPCSIINSAAAAALGLQQPPAKPAPVPAGPAGSGGDGSGGGLFGGIRKLMGGLSSSPVSSGAGPNGAPIAGGYVLRPTDVSMDLSLACSQSDRFNGEGAWAPLGSVRPVVGDLPGFQALGIAEGQPAAILGLDALAGRPSIVLCPRQPAMLV